MGGSWDATNLVAGDVAVIGEIGLDHPELGSTVQEVATEKAGIIKPGKIVVVREQPDEALEVIEARASDMGATVLLESARLGGDRPAARRGRPAVPRPRRARDVRRAVPPDVRRARRAERGGGDRRRRVGAWARARCGCGPRRDRRRSGPRPARGRRSPPADRAGRCAQPGGCRGARAGARARRSPGSGCTSCSAVSSNKDIDGIVAALAPIADVGYAAANESVRSFPAEHVAERVAAVGRPRRGLGTVAEALEAARDAAADGGPHPGDGLSLHCRGRPPGAGHDHARLRRRCATSNRRCSS